MAYSFITTEAGELIVNESIAGYTNASSLNDTKVATIVKEDFDTDPELNGWFLGNDWQWNSTNDNIEIV